MPRAAAAALLLALFAACTSPELRGSYRVAFRYDAPSSSDDLPYPVETVWAALPLAYADLGFPGAVPLNSPRREFTTPQLRVQSQLYGRRNSDFIDCGHHEGGRRLENHGEVMLAMITALEETSPNTTRVRTQVDAYAKRRDVSADPVGCPSLGVLERMVLQALLARLQAAGSSSGGG